MLNLYNPTKQVFEAQSGANLNPELMALNVLIELRVMNALLLAAQSGIVTDQVEQLRQDVVNETAVPSI